MAEPESDDALLAALERGEPDALAEMYDRYASLMTAIAYRLLNNRRDAEDLVHDVFLEAWQKADTYDAQRGSVRSWLMVRLRSRATDRKRTLATARSRSVLLDVPDQTAGEDEVFELARQAGTHSLLESLDTEQRRVVNLAYFEGLTSRDIAKRCSLPVGTVKSRLSRAIARLREQAHAGGRMI